MNADFIHVCTTLILNMAHNLRLANILTVIFMKFKAQQSLYPIGGKVLTAVRIFSPRSSKTFQKKNKESKCARTYYMNLELVYHLVLFTTMDISKSYIHGLPLHDFKYGLAGVVLNWRIHTAFEDGSVSECKAKD